MNDARKLLDSLMGNSRDQDLGEQKKMKGKNFTKDNVCKHYLLGFCPASELASSKMLGKRNIKECSMTHSEALREEFEASSEVEKYRAEYEKSLLPCLESLVREADSWAARERANVQRTELTAPVEQTVNNMPPTVKEQHEQMTQDMNKLMAAAEDLAEKGEVDGSKFKVMLAGEIKEKIKELEEQYIVTYTVTHRGEEVCEICGTRTEAATGANHARYAAHFTGKVHVSYVKIREWIEKIKSRNGIAGSERSTKRKSRSRENKERRDERDRENKERRDERDRDRRDDRERRRSRSRRGDRGGDRGGRAGDAGDRGGAAERRSPRRRDRSRSRRRARD